VRSTRQQHVQPQDILLELPPVPHLSPIANPILSCPLLPPSQVQGGILNFEVLWPDGSVFSYKRFCLGFLLFCTSAP
jgi:hypothetical protein